MRRVSCRASRRYFRSLCRIFRTGRYRFVDRRQPTGSRPVRGVAPRDVHVHLREEREREREREIERGREGGESEGTVSETAGDRRTQEEGEREGGGAGREAGRHGAPKWNLVCVVVSHHHA